MYKRQSRQQEERISQKDSVGQKELSPGMEHRPTVIIRS
jgi:hypothetical protein